MNRKNLIVLLVICCSVSCDQNKTNPVFTDEEMMIVVEVDHAELIYRALTNLDNKKEQYLIPDP